MNSKIDPFKISWRVKSIPQILPDLQAVSVECGYVQCTFSIAVASEEDTTDDCTGPSPQGFDSKGDPHDVLVESMTASLAKVQKALDASQADNRRLRKRMSHAIGTMLDANLDLPPYNPAKRAKAKK
jgi:hypothetical protein